MASKLTATISLGIAPLDGETLADADIAAASLTVTINGKDTVLNADAAATVIELNPGDKVTVTAPAAK